MTATEAREKLEGWRDLLKAKLEGVTPGPWKWNGSRAVYSVGLASDSMFLLSAQSDPNSIKRLALNQIPIPTIKDHQEAFNNARLAGIVRSIVPAMLAGIEAALATFEEEREYFDEKGKGEEDVRYGCKLSSERFLVVVAQAYEPFFQEVQS